MFRFLLVEGKSMGGGGGRVEFLTEKLMAASKIQIFVYVGSWVF